MPAWWPRRPARLLQETANNFSEVRAVAVAYRSDYVMPGQFHRVDQRLILFSAPQTGDIASTRPRREKRFLFRVIVAMYFPEHFAI